MEGSYLDTFNEFNITVKALYDYRAQRFDELSFCKHAIITNVTKHESGWWRGDYGGKRQHWFPANFVQEFSEDRSLDAKASIDSNLSHDNELQNSLGKKRKGYLNLEGASLCMVNQIKSSKGRSNSYPLVEFAFQITLPTTGQCYKIGGHNSAEVNDWLAKLMECSTPKNRKSNTYEMEKNFRIAQDLSDLIVYCCAVQFVPDRIGNFTEMSSFPETKLEKWLSPTACPFLLAYNHRQFTRVYPKGARIDSSNYDPLRMWNNSVQLAALNYQTPDKAMQLNQAKFLYQNGSCGYVLRPKFMFDKDYTPYDLLSLTKLVQPWTIAVYIICARHLTKAKGRGVISPFVEVEIAGAEFDMNKYRTSTVSKFILKSNFNSVLFYFNLNQIVLSTDDNGLNPFWNEKFIFDVNCPELSFLRFVVYDEDVFGEPNFVGQSTYPLTTIRQGLQIIL